MKKYLLIICTFFVCELTYGLEGPMFQHAEPETQREYQELYTKTKKAQATADAAVSSNIPSSYRVLFFSSACPPGWTQYTTSNDVLVRISSGTGGGTGGTNDVSAGLSHTHTENSHTHTTPSHQHQFDYTSAGSLAADSGAQIGTADSSGQPVYQLIAGGSTMRHLNSQTVTDGSSTSGSQSDTGVSTETPTFKYIDIIVCEKD